MQTTGQFDAFSFIKQHKHINYCEAVIFPDGTIEYAFPSHTSKLIRISGIPDSEIWNAVRVCDSPLVWLCNYTSCISVWYDYYIATKKPTRLQLKTLKALYDNKVVAFKIKTEKELIDQSKNL